MEGEVKERRRNERMDKIPISDGSLGHPILQDRFLKTEEGNICE